MRSILEWENVKRTLYPAAALLMLWLSITVIGIQTGPMPIYKYVVWLALVPFFFWIYAIVRKINLGDGKTLNSFSVFVLATILTTIYAIIAMAVTVNFMFLIGGQH